MAVDRKAEAPSDWTASIKSRNDKTPGDPVLLVTYPDGTTKYATITRHIDHNFISGIRFEVPDYSIKTLQPNITSGGYGIPVSELRDGLLDRVIGVAKPIAKGSLEEQFGMGDLKVEFAGSTTDQKHSEKNGLFLMMVSQITSNLIFTPAPSLYP